MAQIPKQNIQFAQQGTKLKFKINSKEVDLDEEALDTEANRNFNKLVEAGELSESDRVKYMTHYDKWKNLAKTGKFNIDTAGPDAIVSSKYEGEASASDLGLDESGETAQRKKFGRFFTHKIKDSDASYMSRLHNLMGTSVGNLGLSELKKQEDLAEKLKLEQQTKQKTVEPTIASAPSTSKVEAEKKIEPKEDIKSEKSVSLSQNQIPMKAANNETAESNIPDFSQSILKIKPVDIKAITSKIDPKIKSITDKKISELEKKKSEYIQRSPTMAKDIDLKISEIRNLQNELSTEESTDKYISRLIKEAEEIEKKAGGHGWLWTKPSDIRNKHNENLKKVKLLQELRKVVPSSKEGGILKAQNGSIFKPLIKIKDTGEERSYGTQLINPLSAKVSASTPKKNIGMQGSSPETIFDKLKKVSPNLSGKDALTVSEIARTIAANRATKATPTTVHIPLFQTPTETPISVKGDYTTKAVFEQKANDLVNSVSKPVTSDIVSNTLIKMQANKQASDISTQGIAADVQSRRSSEQASLDNIMRNNQARSAVANQNLEMLAKKRQAEQEGKSMIASKVAENWQNLWGTHNLEKKAEIQQKEGIQKEFDLQDLQNELFTNPKYKKARQAYITSGYDINKMSPEDIENFKEYDKLWNEGRKRIMLKQLGGTMTKSEASLAKEIWKQRNKESKDFASIYERWISRKLSENEKDEDTAAKNLANYISKILK